MVALPFGNHASCILRENFNFSLEFWDSPLKPSTPSPSLELPLVYSTDGYDHIGHWTSKLNQKVGALYIDLDNQLFQLMAEAIILYHLQSWS